MRFSPLFAHMMVPSNGWRGEGAFFRAEGSARASRFICTRARDAKQRLARSEYGRHADSGVNGPRGGASGGQGEYVRSFYPWRDCSETNPAIV